MSIELKLDTNALSSLIEADPTFRTSIQQSVLTNIANRYLKVANDDISRAISSATEIAKKEVLKNFGSYQNSGYSDSRFRLEQSILDNIKQKVSEAVSTEVVAMISKTIDDTIVERLAGIEAKIEAKVAAAVIRYTDQSVANAVKGKVENAIAQLNALAQLKL